MYTHAKNAAIAGQNSIAPADARRMRIIRQARSKAFTKMAVDSSRREWNAPSWWRWQGFLLIAEGKNQADYRETADRSRKMQPKVAQKKPHFGGHNAAKTVNLRQKDRRRDYK